MKIDLILLSSNENLDYSLFFPIVKPIWEKVLNCKCKMIYIGNNISEKLINYKDDIILFKPIEGIQLHL